MHILRIRIADNCPNKDFVIDYYKNKAEKIGYDGDSGIDLICPEDMTLPTNTVTMCALGIECEFIPAEFYTSGQSGPFRLEPRSSISKTPLMLANSAGIIDAGYRGQLVGAFRCFVDRKHQITMNESIYKIIKGDRLLQIVAPDLKPIKVELVTELSKTERGANGFGSTN